MKREFVINIIFLIVVNFIIKPFYIFGIDARVQNLVGPEQFGIYFVLYDLIFLVQVVNDPGIQSYNSKYIAQNRDSINLHLPGVLGLKLLLGILFLLSALLVSWMLGYHQYYMIAGIAGIFFLSTLYILLRSSLSSLGHFRLDSLFSVVDKLILIGYLGYLVWIGPGHRSFSVLDFVYGQVYCYLAAVVILGLFLVSKNITVLPAFKWTTFGRILQKSLPYSFVILLTAAYMRIDAIMIEKLVPDGFTESGLYAAGYRFVDAANMVGYLFGALLLPMYSNMLAERQSVQPVFSIAFRLLLSMGVLLMLVSFFYHAEIFNLMYTREYHSSSNILSVLMLSIVPLALSHSLGSLLQAASKVKALNYLLLGGLILNVAINFFFIPEWGAIGAAWATFITEAILLFSLIGVAIHSNVIVFERKIYQPCILLLALAPLCFYGVKNYLHFHWLLVLLLSLLLYILVVLFSSVLQVSEIKNVMFKASKSDEL